MSDAASGKDNKFPPNFELPKFDLSGSEIPAAFRELAEKGASQAKDNWEKIKVAADEATDTLESSYSAAAKGTTDYGMALFDVMRANMNAAFEFASEMAAAKSPSDILALSTAHARKQFETATAQAKELTALAQKLATEAAEPIKSSVEDAIKKND